MSSLSALQNQLLAEIFSPQESNHFDSAGLAIYRANLRATALNALTITFPTVAQLVGEEMMTHAAEILLKQHPPYQGDWAVWGEQFASVLGGISALDDYPFIPMSAELDYHCHQLIRQADIVPDHSSLRLLQVHEPNELALVLSPGLQLIESEYPIAAIRQAHQQASAEQRSAALQEAFNTDRDRQDTACFRDGVEVRIETLSREDFLFTKALLQHSLGVALDQMNNTTFDFQNWLLFAIRSNLLINVQLLTPIK